MVCETALLNVEVKLEPETSGADRGRRSIKMWRAQACAGSHFASILPIAVDAE